MSELILLSGTASQDGGGMTQMLGTLVPLLLIFVIFYLLLIRPQQKKQKEHQRVISELKKGDKVVTQSGMHGVISSINEEKNVVVLKVCENVKIEFLKSSIAGKIE